MNQKKETILITGGAGFIGSHVVRKFLHSGYRVVNLDKLTYAGNLENLKDVDTLPTYSFIKGDINDIPLVTRLFEEYDLDGVIHLAAESHVDRSITNPTEFVQTNVFGTNSLLEVARKMWKNNEKGKRFYHVSTDEVYGTLAANDFFLETTPYDPRSPYSASKASSDHFVRAYGNTYGLPFVISNCSNNYGANQFPEKLIPLIILNIQRKKPLPIYGNGSNVRDWLYVEDHAEAISLIYEKGENAETYNIGGMNQCSNINLVELLCDQMDKSVGNKEGTSRQLITFVKDRAGHDERYAIDASKLSNTLGWQPQVNFEQGLKKTIDWYLTNAKWLERVVSGEYASYYQNQYGKI